MIFSTTKCLLIHALFLIFSCACYEIVTIPDEDIRYLNERLQTKDGMSEEDALNSIVELEHYYIAAKNDIDGEPSEMIDKAWHVHILNTPMYFKFCEAQFGKYIHHLPFWSGNMPDEDDLPESFREPMYDRLKGLRIHSINENGWTYQYPTTTPTNTVSDKNNISTESV